MLHVGKDSFCLSSLLLNASSRNLYGDSCLLSFKTLSLNKLGISYRQVVLILSSNYSKLILFEYFHLCLIEGLLNQDVEHGFDFCVEIKKLVVAIIDLSRFAKILWGHSWLEQRHGWSIQVELSCNSDFKLLRLVSEVFFVLVCLNFEMLTAVGWLR